jgi:c(7)-type cytochrome triheme protein
MADARRGIFNGGQGDVNTPPKSLLMILVFVALIASSAEVYAGEFWDLPPLPKRHEYGDILIDRLLSKNEVKSVFFSHWSHRAKYTCRVCHWELDFAFEVGGTEMTEADNRNGLYCGKCHDGKVAFGHTEDNCQRCHTGIKASKLDKFNKLRDDLQKDKFGNGINWTAAIRAERIKPLYSIFKPEEKPLEFRKRLELKAEWNFVPPAVFPHDVHVRWLDCGSCHPDIFKLKKKTTEHFLMKYILEEKFCGVCHLRVAFPMDDCKRCHPALH